MVVLGAIVFVLICLLFIFSMVMVVMAIVKRRKGETLNPLELIHFIYKDQNHPSCLHIFGAIRSLRNMNAALKYSHYHVLLDLEARQSKAFFLFSNYKNKLDKENVTSYIKKAQKDKGLSFSPIPVPENDGLKFHLFYETKSTDKNYPYPSHTRNRIIFITEVNGHNNRMEVQIYRHHNLLNTFFIEGSIHHQFNEIYLHDMQLFIFTYLADDLVADKGIGVCAINYETGDLIFSNGI